MPAVKIMKATIIAALRDTFFYKNEIFCQQMRKLQNIACQ